MACKCTICPVCGGTGYVWYSSNGEYLGKGRCDDMDILEDCEVCEGTGIEFCCYECQAEYDDDFND